MLVHVGEPRTDTSVPRKAEGGLTHTGGHVKVEAETAPVAPEAGDMSRWRVHGRGLGTPDGENAPRCQAQPEAICRGGTGDCAPAQVCSVSVGEAVLRLNLFSKCLVRSPAVAAALAATHRSRRSWRGARASRLCAQGPCVVVSCTHTGLGGRPLG